MGRKIKVRISMIVDMDEDEVVIVPGQNLPEDELLGLAINFAFEKLENEEDVIETLYNEGVVEAVIV